MRNNLDFLKSSGNVIIFYPSIANMVGSINAGLLLCQFFFYTQHEPDEAVFISHSKVKKTTALTRTQFETARKVLVDLGILEVFLKGVPAKNCYKINWEKLEDVYLNFQIAENQHTNKTNKQACQKGTTLFAENQQTITDTTYIEGSDDNLIKKEKENKNQIFLTKNYKPCTDLFFEFYKNVLQLPPPKFDGAEGKALKTIIIYFRDNLPPDDEMRAQTALKWVFDNWKLLPKFYQEQISLKQINSRLLQMINEIKKLSTGETKKGGLENIKNYAEQVRAGI